MTGREGPGSILNYDFGFPNCQESLRRGDGT